MTEYKSEFSGKQIDEAVGWAQTNRSVNLQELQKEVSGKQEALRTGTGIKLKGNVISVDDSVPTLEDLIKEESERMAADLLRPTKSEVGAMLATAKELLFRDMWNLACFRGASKNEVGKYNEETGFYECNGITDLTYEDALLIYNTRRTLGGDMQYAYSYTTRDQLGRNLRTNLFTNIWFGNTALNGMSIVALTNIEVLRLGYEWANTVRSRWSTLDLTRCSTLRRIVGYVDISMIASSSLNLFGDKTTKVEDFRFYGCKHNMNLTFQPLINCESILYMVENSSGTNALVWQVHADVFNRCADYEVSEEYPNIIDYALIKYNITIGIV